MSSPLKAPGLLDRLNRRSWFVRWPAKWALFGLAYTLVCFPYPRLVIRHILHWSNPDAIVEPDAPALQPLAEELRASLPPGLAPQKVLDHVEKFVYQKVPYEWDWNTWGMADYLPTVDEVLQMKKEDCDGRAVVAASLLRNLGYEARLVTDFAHVWVSTPQGQTMGPGKTKTVEVTEKGVKVDYRGLLELPRIMGYGIAVFPLGRELILVFVLWLLLLGSSGKVRSIVCLLLLIGGLILLRYGASSYRGPVPILEPLGAVTIIAAFLMMMIHRTRKYPAPNAESNLTNTGGNPL